MIFFEPCENLHPYTVELVESALHDLPAHSSLAEVVRHCENAVCRDNGNHLHRDDGEIGSDCDSHCRDVECV
jgi:hypothetical protein